MSLVPFKKIAETYKAESFVHQGVSLLPISLPVHGVNNTRTNLQSTRYFHSYKKVTHKIYSLVNPLVSLYRAIYITYNIQFQ